MDVEIADQEFTFEIINFSDDVESIAREKDSNMRSIIQQLDNVSSEVQGYNSGIETQIKQAFEARKLENISKEQYISVLRCAYLRRLAIESELRKLLYGRLGLFVSLVVGFLALLGYFGKKLGDNLRLEVQQGVALAPATNAAQQKAAAAPGTPGR